MPTCFGLNNEWNSNSHASTYHQGPSPQLHPEYFQGSELVCCACMHDSPARGGPGGGGGDLDRGQQLGEDHEVLFGDVPHLSIKVGLQAVHGTQQLSRGAASGTRSFLCQLLADPWQQAGDERRVQLRPLRANPAALLLLWFMALSRRMTLEVSLGIYHP